MRLGARKFAQGLLTRGRQAIAVLDPAVRSRQRLAGDIETRLGALANRFPSGSGAPPGRTLVDGMWFNPNYLYRLSIMRAALGSVNGEEIGLVGEFSARRSAAAFRRLGIEDIVSFESCKRETMREATRLADSALSKTRGPQDILGWELPEGFPAEFVYDGILKRQRAASVDITRGDFRDVAVDAFASAIAASRLIERLRPDVVLLSHALNFSYAAVAWASMRRGIPTIVLFGNYGVPRFFRLAMPSDLYDWNNGPSAEDLDALPSEAARALQELGQEYLARRMGGQTDDIGGQFAFRKVGSRVSREALCARFGWCPNKPIMAVYAHNWFDFPHACGLSQFRDYLDWLEQTIAAAGRMRDMNWLFKAHPCDAWYGGVTLRDLLPESLPEHIGVAPTDWNGADLIAAADALVTVQSTGGLEFACQGKPVLLADRGWYDKAGFAVLATSREDYLAKMQSQWWRGINLGKMRERALIFAGAYFCAPTWQNGLFMLDDSLQDALWHEIDRILSNESGLAREIATIAAWLGSGEKRLHLYKMLRIQGRMGPRFA